MNKVKNFSTGREGYKVSIYRKVQLVNEDIFNGRKCYPQITQIAQIKLKADRGVKKYNLRESA